MSTSRQPLWVGREDRADHPWLASPPAAPPPAEPPPPPPRRRGPVRRTVLAGLAALALLGAGLAGGTLLDSDEGADPVAVLPPAAGGRPSDTRVNTIYARASAGVVQVRTGGGSGTGFVVDRRGTLVTNAHVAGDADEVRVLFDGGRPVRAEVLGTDPSSDLAVLRVDRDEAPRLVPLPLADSDQVRVGDTAIAIGYPLGLDRTATQGIVSGVGRQIQAPDGFSIDEVIQTDAPINPGNSGGPLLDVRGRVIGVNSQIATAGSRGNVGIGFAVPADTVREVVPRLARGEEIERPYLGVSTTTPALRTGAEVAEVRADGPAARAGLEAGDVIVSIDGRGVADPDDVTSSLDGRDPGEEIEVEIVRGGRERTLSIELGERPTQVP